MQIAKSQKLIKNESIIQGKIRPQTAKLQEKKEIRFATEDITSPARLTLDSQSRPLSYANLPRPMSAIKLNQFSKSSCKPLMTSQYDESGRRKSIYKPREGNLKLDLLNEHSTKNNANFFHLLDEA